jgi:hypothetical protein
LENYVRVMTAELERAEARAKAATEQLMALDDDIESRIGRIVSLLSSVKDSTEGSSVRMRKAKEDALEGLKATAVYYAQQRDFRKKAMGNPNSSIDDETLAKQVASLNARIEERVAQSLELAGSLTQHEEAPDPEYRVWNGLIVDDSHETREHKRSEHDARESVKVRKELVDTLNASIVKLSSDIKASEAELAATTDSERKAQIVKDIQTLRDTIAARQSQIEEAVTPPKPATREVASKGAFELDKMIDEMVLDLRTDFAKFKTLVGENDAARARIKPLKDRLEKANSLLGAPAVK